MADEVFNSNDNLTTKKLENVPSSIKKKQSRSLWFIFLAFVALVVIVFLTQHKTPIAWVEDYQAGIEMAKQQNKPVLLAFYKQFTHMSTSTFNNTYIDPDVKKYVEENFIPILIDVDKQPDIAKQYNINYYPTHYIKRPDSDDIFGPVIGYSPPQDFINKVKGLLQEMEQSNR